MNCENTRTAIDTHEAVTSGITLAADVQAHLLGCIECQEYANAKILSGLLVLVSNAAIPEGLPEGLEDRIINTALSRSHSRSKQRLSWMISSAAAVFLVIAVALMQLVGGPANAVNQVLLTVNEVKPVQIMLASKIAMDDAQLKIISSKNIAVAGYSDIRELSWKTNLAEGDNLLVLPLQLLHPSDGIIEVLLEHGGSSKSYVINITPKINTTNDDISISI